MSFVCTNLVKMLMKFIKKIAAYIDSQHIEEAEQHILEIIKILEYKKSAINMRNLVTGSIINEELNITEFRHEAD